ncbi:MAG: HAMP domain-containing histidine kinase [Deltaproteobacteria bacterium]|nr:HAMP domain-containing histidine kinase [Deltaproteobacteria bacterium]
MLSHVVFAVLAGLILFMCVEVCAGVIRSVNTPFVGFNMTEEGFVSAVALDVWAADEAGFLEWDRVVAVDGELTFTAVEVVREAILRKSGSEVVYELESATGRRHFAAIATRTFSAVDIFRSQCSLAFLGLACVLIAILLYVLRPAALESWSFFLFFASVGLCMVSVVDMTFSWNQPVIFPYLTPFLTVFGFLLVGSITRAFSSHATQDQMGRFLRRLMVMMLLIAMAVSTFIALNLYFSQGDILRYRAADVLMYSWLAFCTLGGLVALVIAYRRGRSPRRRARIRQILWAWPVGAGIPTMNLFFGHVLGVTEVSFLWNGFIILMPLSTADAIVRHDLLHLNTTARRLVGSMTIAALMGSFLGLALWTASRFLGVRDAAGMLALASLLFAGAAPLTHRVQRYVEDLLRSARYNGGELLVRFTGRASTATKMKDVVGRLKETLSSSVKPTFFELYRYDPQRQRFLPELRKDGPSLNSSIELRRLFLQTKATLFDDELPPPLELESASMALPLTVANEPVGLLLLGNHDEGLPYEAADEAFVTSLAGPLGAALVNTSAYEAVAELNRDLERRVQERTFELEQKNAELALLNQRKDELVATVSHDFRSPLAIIRQNVQTLLRDLNLMDEGDTRGFLESVIRQEGRLTSMCTNLLDLARLKNVRPFDEKVDLAQLAESIVSDHQARAVERKVKLETSASQEEGSALLLGEKERLLQVLQNLVDNALKFTTENGQVLVEVTTLETEIQLQIKDTGCGVPEESIERLFEPFYQVPMQSHVGQGSGLGLAIVHAVVEGHGGRIQVTSAPDEGTCFRLSFPRAF